jgi:hypothetical protein
MRVFPFFLGLAVASSTLCGEAMATTTYNGPIVVTKGGTYTGNWQSLNPNTPAVSIQTTAPVTLLNCHINSSGDGIQSTYTGAQLTVHGCYGVGLDPKIYGKQRGDLLRVWQAAKVTVEHNDITGFAFGTYSWGNMKPSSFIFQYNTVHDLQGADSDGNGGVLTDAAHMQFGQDNGNHAVIKDSMHNMTYAEIAWNSFTVSSPAYSIGDIVNIYRSSGTPSTPIEVHDNYFYGGYAARPSQVASCCAANAVTSEAITADGSGSDTSSTTVAFTHIFNNYIANNGGAQGVGINAGHDNQLIGNHIISTGRLKSNGSWFAATYSNELTTWNGVYHQPSSVYYNNTAHDNHYGWTIATLNSQGNGRAAPVHLSPPNFQGCPSTLCYSNIQNIYVSFATEDNLLKVWQSNVKINKLVVGPQ